MKRDVALVLVVATAAAVVFASAPALAQAPEDPPPGVSPPGDVPQPPPPLPSSVYVPPTREEWLAASLEPSEYDLAVKVQVSLDDWKAMDNGRRTHRAAGWALIGIGLLSVPLELTIIYGADIPFDRHPAQEAYIMGWAGGFACLVTGVVLLMSTPGPEDFQENAFRSEGGLQVSPAPGGLMLGYRW
jgi:hypothetical protein